MSPSKETLPRYIFLAELAEERVNARCEAEGSGYRFEYIVTCAESSPDEALELTEAYHLGGVDLVVGYAWNSQLEASMGYAVENGMVLVSPGSTSPLYARNDTVYRLCPDDNRQAAAIATAIAGFGVHEAVILHRDDQWGAPFAESLLWECRAQGVEATTRLGYTSGETDYHGVLLEAEEAIEDAVGIRGAGKVAVAFIGLGEASAILNKAMEYPGLVNVTWFGTDATTLDPRLIQEAGEAAAKVTLVGPENVHVYNEDFREVEALYAEEFNTPLDFYTANVYDGCMLAALAVAEADSAKGLDVAEVFPEVAYGHYGITGPLDLNPAGDRSWIRYYFYGYYGSGEHVMCIRNGHYTRLEKYGHLGSEFSAEPYLYDPYAGPVYLLPKQHEAK